jgi:formylglycine-generating enzyme required for sulfatase activity
MTANQLNRRTVRQGFALRAVRLFFLSFAALLALHFTLHAQEQKVPPKHFTNSIGMKFAWIPPGSFVMGSPQAEKQRNDSETQHKVTLTKGFYMGVHLVTQEQWQEVMGMGVSSLMNDIELACLLLPRGKG